MKASCRAILSLILVACLLFAATALIGCETNPTPTPAPQPDGGTTPDPDAVTLNIKEKTLDFGESFRLIATSKTGGDVVWSTDNDSVATVDGNGNVTAVGEGVANITAAVGEDTASCKVSVVNSLTAPILSIYFGDYERDSITLPHEGTGTLTAKATYKGVEKDVDLTWGLAAGADTETIAITPAADGKTCAITATGYGTTTVAVSAVVHGVPLTTSIDIAVLNTDTILQIDELDVEDGRYVLTMDLFENKNFVPAATLTYRGEPVDVTNLTWHATDTDIVDVAADGTVTAKAVGTTTVVADYLGGGAMIAVTVEKAEKNFTTVFDVETYRKTTIDFTGLLLGDVEKILFKGKDLLEDYDAATHVATLEMSALTEWGEGKLVTIETTAAVYEAALNIYTMVIRTADDIDILHQVADALKEDSGEYAYMDGYYVLGNDIAYNRTFRAKANAGGTWSVWAGFAGTFDGKGHVIDGMTMGAPADGALTHTTSGFFPGLTGDGIIKNVAFTNAVHEGYGGFITSFGKNGGTVENVYVHLLSFTARVTKANIFSSYGSVAVKNCVAIVDAYNQNAQTQAGVIGWKNETDTVENVYAISPSTDLALLGYNVATAGAIKDGVYASPAAMTAAKLDFSSFDTDFWANSKGVAYPKACEGKVTFTAAAPRTWGSETITIPLSGQYASLTVASTESGVKLDGRKLELPATETGYTVTVTATLYYDATKTATWVVTVSPEVQVNAGTLGNIEMQTDLNTKYSLTGHDTAETFSITVTDAVSVQEYVVKINGATVHNADMMVSTDGKTFTFPKSVFGDTRGDVTIKISCVSRENGDVTGMTGITATATVADMVIRTADDLDAMQTIADDLKADADASYALMSGYFVLGNDIAYNRTFHTNANAGGTWSAASNSGFTGTFDGRGHVIDGMTMGTVKDGALAQTRSGLFPSLIFGGTIKNVVFTNAVHEGYGGFVSSYARYSTYFLGGTVENVYVHLTSFTANAQRAGVFSCFGGVLVKNCIVVVDQYNANGQTLPGVIGWDDNADRQPKNLYVISPSDTLVTFGHSTVLNTSNVKQGIYASWSAFAAAELDLTGFDTSFWKVESGIVYPKTIAKPTDEKDS